MLGQIWPAARIVGDGAASTVWPVHSQTTLPLHTHWSGIAQILFEFHMESGLYKASTSCFSSLRWVVTWSSTSSHWSTSSECCIALQVWQWWWATFGERENVRRCRVMQYHNQGRNSQLQSSAMQFYPVPTHEQCTVHNAIYWAVSSAQWTVPYIEQCAVHSAQCPILSSAHCTVPYIASWCEVGGVAGTVMICSVDHWVLSATLSRVIIILLTVRIIVIITIERILVITTATAYGWCTEYL